MTNCDRCTCVIFFYVNDGWGESNVCPDCGRFELCYECLYDHECEGEAGLGGP